MAARRSLPHPLHRACCEMIGLIDPARAAEPAYLLTDAQVRKVYPIARGICGFTSLGLCWRLRWIIGDAWRGPGFCCVVAPRRIKSVAALVGAVLHELAHHVADRYDACMQVLASDDLGQAALATLQAAPAAPRAVQPCQSAGDWEAQHGPAFLRICAHIAYRSNRYWAGDLADLVGPSHEAALLCDSSIYCRALGDEPAALAGEPLATIAASPAPPAYEAFVRWDRERIAALRGTKT